MAATRANLLALRRKDESRTRSAPSGSPCADLMQLPADREPPAVVGQAVVQLQARAEVDEVAAAFLRGSRDQIAHIWPEGMPAEFTAIWTNSLPLIAQSAAAPLQPTGYANKQPQPNPVAAIAVTEEVPTEMESILAVALLAEIRIAAGGSWADILQPLVAQRLCSRTKGFCFRRISLAADACLPPVGTLSNRSHTPLQLDRRWTEPLFRRFLPFGRPCPSKWR